MNLKYFGELARYVDAIVHKASLLQEEIDKCAYTANDLPVKAVRHRTQKYFSELEKLIEMGQKAIDQG